MKKEINGESLKEFIASNFDSKTDFMKKYEIAPSHLYKLFKEKVSVGDKTYEKLEKACEQTDWNVSDLIKDEVFEVGGGKCRALAITDDKGSLIALIMKDKFLIDKDYDYFLQE